MNMDRLTGGRFFLPILALTLILLFNLAFNPEFFHLEIKDERLYGSLIDVLNRSAPVALLAIGMSLVVATGGIDLSVGTIAAISGAICANLLTGPFDPLLFVLPAALLCGFAAGAVNGALVSLLGIQPFIATLILMVTGRGIAQFINDGQVITYQNYVFSSIGVGSIAGLPSPVVIVLLVFVTVQFLVRYSSLGLFIEACGYNPKASYYSGVNVTAIKFLVYCVSGVCAAIAGIIITADIQGADASNAGMWLELDAVLAVTLGGASLMGGRFSLPSTLISVLVVQSMATTIVMSGIDPRYNLLVKSVVIVFILLMQSTVFRAQIRHFIAQEVDG